MAKAEEAASAAAAARMRAEEKATLLELELANAAAESETKTADAVALFQRQVRRGRGDGGVVWKRDRSLPPFLQIAELAARVSLGDDKLRSKEAAYAQLRADHERQADELIVLAKHLQDAQDSLLAMKEAKVMDADVKTALAQVRRGRRRRGRARRS